MHHKKGGKGDDPYPLRRFAPNLLGNAFVDLDANGDAEDDTDNDQGRGQARGDAVGDGGRQGGEICCYHVAYLLLRL